MRLNIVRTATKLMCDAPGCTHVEEVVVDTSLLVGKPCPLCGANLLTEADYQQALAVAEAIEAMNAVAPIPEGAERVPLARLSIKPHDGELNVWLTDEPRT